jgi:hypothetical protein
VRRYLANVSVTPPRGLERKHPAIETILRGAARCASLPRRVRSLQPKQVRAMLRDLGEVPADVRVSDFSTS